MNRLAASLLAAALVPACAVSDDVPFTDAPALDDPFLDAVESALSLPTTPYAYAAVPLPAHFQTPGVRARDNTPSDNPVTDAGATLGRVLFYDTALSANDTVSCASCHVQEYGFSDPARFSVGFEGGTTGRNSMGLSNSRFYAETRNRG